MSFTAGMDWPALVTLWALTLCLATAWLVGSARLESGVKAPATAGHARFERARRVPINTRENVAIFLPALWLSARDAGPRASTVPGAVWLAGRMGPAVAEMAGPKKRGPGFTLADSAGSRTLLGHAPGVLSHRVGR